MPVWWTNFLYSDKVLIIEGEFIIKFQMLFNLVPKEFVAPIMLAAENLGNKNIYDYRNPAFIGGSFGDRPFSRLLLSPSYN